MCSGSSRHLHRRLPAERRGTRLQARPWHDGVGLAGEDVQRAAHGSAGNSLATPPANLSPVRLLSGGGKRHPWRPGSHSSGGGPSPPAAPVPLPGEGAGTP